MSVFVRHWAACQCLFALILSSWCLETVKQLEESKKQQPNVHYCNIYNEQHNHFYMYATSRFFSVSAVSRSVYLWSRISKKQKPGNLTFFGSNGDDQSIWRLEPVANRTACYRIRNVLYDELLYRSTFLSGLAVPARNYVYTWSEWVLGGRATVVSQDDEAFMWTFGEVFEPDERVRFATLTSQSGEQERVVASRVRKATIWNVKFNEPLYVPLYGGNGMLTSRVYTWSGDPDSILFNWILICSDDGE